jgi:hypothetical protein
MAEHTLEVYHALHLDVCSRFLIKGTKVSDQGIYIVSVEPVVYKFGGEAKIRKLPTPQQKLLGTKNDSSQSGIGILYMCRNYKNIKQIFKH